MGKGGKLQLFVTRRRKVKVMNDAQKLLKSISLCFTFYCTLRGGHERPERERLLAYLYSNCKTN